MPKQVKINESTVKAVKIPENNIDPNFNPDKKMEKEKVEKKHVITINFFNFLTQLSHPIILWGVLILYIVFLYPLSEIVDTIKFWSLKFFIQWASLIIDSIKPVLVFVAGIVINDYVNHIKNKK